MEVINKFIAVIKKYLIPIIIACAVIIGGGVFFIINDKDTLTFSNGEELTIYGGDTADLTVVSKKNRTYTSSDLVFESESSLTAGVTETGQVKGLKAGYSKITCKLAKKRCVPAEINIHVKNDTLSLNEVNGISMTAGDTKQLTVTAESGRPAEAGVIKYRAASSYIAEVSDTGKITAKSEGTTTIYVSRADGTSNTAQVTVTVKLKKVDIKNGQILKNPKGAKLAPLRVTAAKDRNFYIYMKNSKNKSNDFAFYVKKGKTVNFNIPLGNYTIYYATGTTWYGKKAKFGKETTLRKINGTVKFYRSGNRYMGHSFQLYSVANGNVTTSYVGNNDFPE